MNTPRKVLHATLMAVGFVPWVISVACMAFVTWLSLLGERVLPDAKAQNCWTYALPKWHRHGGYLLIRAADGVRFLRRFIVPHVSWVRVLPEGVDLESFAPDRRKRASLAPWHTVYYAGHVSRHEKPHNATQPEPE